jgi:hypothetical protein
MLFRDILGSRSAEESTSRVSDSTEGNAGNDLFWSLVVGMCIWYKVKFVKGTAVSSREELKSLAYTQRTVLEDASPIVGYGFSQ